VRRFLDRFGGKVAKVCFCVDSAEDLSMCVTPPFAHGLCTPGLCIPVHPRTGIGIIGTPSSASRDRSPSPLPLCDASAPQSSAVRRSVHSRFTTHG
jgi:hypothetical protein